jgi:hypothetical protein
MDAARAARSPQLSACLEVPAYGAPPADGGESAWRAAGRPLVRWLGIGVCVLLLGLLLATLRTQPIGAAIERLIAPERAAQQDQEAAPAPAGRVAPVVPERTAAHDRPPHPAAMAPLLVSTDLPPAARPIAATPPRPPAASAAAPDTRPLPIPVLKPQPAAS